MQTNVDVSSCVELLFEQIGARLPRDALVDPNQFRAERLYAEDADAVLRRAQRDLRVVYDRYCCRTARGAPRDAGAVHRDYDANVTPR